MTALALVPLAFCFIALTGCDFVPIAARLHGPSGPRMFERTLTSTGRRAAFRTVGNIDIRAVPSIASR